MQQYREIKSRHQDAILFFRMGDFYEMFYDDAETASRAIGLTLTSRNNGGAAEVPLAGIPVKAAAEYLRRLVGQGFRVAICEQVEDPKFAKGLVKREVVETITPGAVFADDLLDGARANYVCAIATGRDAARDGARDQIGIAAADLSTGEWRLFLVTPMDAPAVLARLAPRELLLVRGASHPELAAAMTAVDNVLMTEREGWEFDAQLAADELARQFDVQSLEGFGLGSDDVAAVGAAGALLRYLRELQPGGLPHLARPVVERPGGVMPLDEMTRRNLELVESLRGGELAGTLLSVMDRTATPMGQRLLRQWLLAPLLERAAIELRLDAVTVLVRDPWDAPACAMRSTACVMWSDWRARRLRVVPPRASCAPWAIRWRACRRCPTPCVRCWGTPRRDMPPADSSPRCWTIGTTVAIARRGSRRCWWSVPR
jgi:DNA mismatch repair protein MutS